MRTVPTAASILLLWIVLSLSAAAQVPERAQAAFDAGRFLTAAMLAENESTADALAFAARARIADAVTREAQGCMSCIVHAEASAEAAIKTDPNLTEAYVQLAIATGLRGRLLDTMEAQSEGLIEKGRAAIDRALELEPANAWALACLGAWHLEIVHRAGSLLAAIVYDAHEEEGLKSFDEAARIDPANALIELQFALSLLALDQRHFRHQAEEALARGMADPRTDTLTMIMRSRAENLTDTLKTGTPNEIAALVRRYQFYPQ